ncbi:hypothetical protein D3C84_724850 [compost metagenome]
MQAAVAAQRGETAFADRVVEHATGDRDFAGDGLALGVDHGHRGRGGEVVDVDETVIAAGLQGVALGQRLGALVRDQHFPGRRQGRAVPGGQHVGAGAAGAARIPDVGAVEQLAVMAQGRRRGKAGRDHAEHAFLVGVDHGDTAGDEAFELDIDDERAVRFSGEGQGGLADAGVGRQVRAGTVQTEYKQAQA